MLEASEFHTRRRVRATYSNPTITSVATVFFNGKLQQHACDARRLQCRDKATDHRRRSNTDNCFRLGWGECTQHTDLDTERTKVGEATE